MPALVKYVAVCGVSITIDISSTPYPNLDIN